MIIAWDPKKAVANHRKHGVRPPPGMREARSLVRGRRNSVRTELACENLRAIEKGLDTLVQAL